MDASFEPGSQDKPDKWPEYQSNLKNDEEARGTKEIDELR
jgi:hypothetical protein